MSRRSIAAVFAVSILTVGAVARADDKVDDPRAAAWANHKVGSSVHMAGTLDRGQMKAAVEMTFTLKKVSDDKKSVTVEFGGYMEAV